MICGSDCPDYMGAGCDLNSDAMVQCKRKRPVIGDGFFAGKGSVIGGDPMIFSDGKPVEALGGLIIGENVWVGARAVIMKGDKGPTRIGPNVIIGPDTTVGHDSIIGDGARILLGAHIAGYVEIGERALICMGALIRNHIKIGKCALVGMGAVVVKDVPAYTVVYGNPARVDVKRSVKRYIVEQYKRVVR